MHFQSQDYIKSPPKSEASSKTFSQGKADSVEDNGTEAFSVASPNKVNDSDAHLERSITQDISQTVSRASTKHDNEPVSVQVEAATVKETPSRNAQAKRTKESKQKVASESKKSDAGVKTKGPKAKKSTSSVAESVKSDKTEKVPEEAVENERGI